MWSGCPAGGGSGCQTHALCHDTGALSDWSLMTLLPEWAGSLRCAGRADPAVLAVPVNHDTLPQPVSSPAVR